MYRPPANDDGDAVSDSDDDADTDVDFGETEEVETGADEIEEGTGFFKTRLISCIIRATTFTLSGEQITASSVPEKILNTIKL